MQLMIPPEGTRQDRVYVAIRAAILTGQVNSGDRLPSTRALSIELGFSRNTVSAAFDQLKSEGYISSRVGSGSYVAPLPEKMLLAARQRGPQRGQSVVRLSRYGKRSMGLPEQTPHVPLRYDFRYGLPDLETDFQSIWRRHVARNVFPAEAPRGGGYALAEGHEPLREALADYLKRARGVRCDAHQILITNGSQQALDLIARHLLDPGDLVSIEDPHYLGAREVFRANGGNLLPVDVDAEGMKTPRSTDSRLAYVTPSHQFPCGVVMSLQRRLALLDWAERTGAFIVEDDYDSEFRYRGAPVPAIQGLQPGGRVIYVGTFSKVLFPGLRLGFLVLPTSLVGSFRKAKWLTDRGSSTLEQRSLTDLINAGDFERLLRRARTRNSKRRDALIDALEKFVGPDLEVHGSPSGLHLLTWAPQHTEQQLADITSIAGEHGVGVYSISPYYLNMPGTPGLLFGFGSLEVGEIYEGIRLLGRIFQRYRSPRSNARSP